MKDPNAMRGTIVLDNAPGRALRKARSAVRAADVLYCAGGFRDGDPVYVTFRGDDGGQQVVATAIVRCDAAELRRRIEKRAQSGDSVEDQVVCDEQDVELIWTPR